MMTRAELVEKRTADAGAMYQPLMRRAYSGDCSPREAIKAFCLSCTGYERAAVTNCTSQACPLFLFRPYQKGGEE